MALFQRNYQALLSASATVTLDSSGNGIAVVGPQGLGNAWNPTQVGVSTSTSVKTPTASLYIGPYLPVLSLSTLINTSQIMLLAGTSTGDNDSIGLLGINVQPGQALIVQWLGGDASATAVFTVAGWQTATYWR